jgi:hypothetical protein
VRVAIAVAVLAAIALGLFLASGRLVGRRDGGPVAVEVRPRRATTLGRATGRPLDDALLELLRRRPDVVAVVPRMELAVPALAAVDLRGEAIRFEAGGFTDGIPASALADDPALAARFADVDPAAPRGAACRPEDGARACPPPLARWYCDARDHLCHRRVPVIVSPTVVELYDQQLAREHDLPPSDVIGVVPGAATDGPVFTFILGESMVAPADPTPARATRHLIGAVIVGVSPRARTIGLTVPLAHVAAWNRELGGGDPAGYSAITVHLRGADARTAFTRAIEALGYDVDEVSSPGSSAGAARTPRPPDP